MDALLCPSFLLPVTLPCGVCISLPGNFFLIYRMPLRHLAQCAGEWRNYSIPSSSQKRLMRVELVSEVCVLHHVQGFLLGLSSRCLVTTGSMMLATFHSLYHHPTPHWCFSFLPNKSCALKSFCQDLPLGKTKSKCLPSRMLQLEE